MVFSRIQENGRDTLDVFDQAFEDLPALRRQLGFLAGQRDQCSDAKIVLPPDVPLNRMLRESQLPHRVSNHPYAQLKPMTRMQVRVLDHKRLLESMRLTADHRGEAIVAVRETEGHVSRFKVTLENGRATVAESNATPTFECSDVNWAGIVCGDLPASSTVRFGLADGTAAAASLLDLFSVGPAPFCHEFF
jgi:hypothetical protein